MLEKIKPNLHKPFEDFQNKTNDMEDLLVFSTNEFMKSDYVSLSKDVYYINKKRFLDLPFLLKINIIKKILSIRTKFYFSKNLLEELDELLNEEKTYQEYLIEKDAGIHDNKTSTDKEVILEELEELLKEESTNEQDNETSAIVPNIHTS